MCLKCGTCVSQKCDMLVMFQHGGGSDDGTLRWLEDFCGVRASILDFTNQEVKAVNPQCKELSVSISCGAKIHLNN